MEQSYRDHLAAVKRQIREQTPAEAAARRDADPAPVLVDVRERDEYEQGYIPGALHIPRGNLESRVERAIPDRSTPVVIYCASGNRSVYAAKTLAELGYEDVVSMSGGFQAWKQNGHEWRVPRALSPEQFERYSRHVLIPEVGEEGQLKLLDSKVLLIGAGGLGSPAAVYLAAAGIGTLGIVDFDEVDLSNLQRQILHTNADVGRSKVESAVDHLRAINPSIEVVGHDTLLFSDNVFDIMEPYDVVIDGTDNFPVRYLVNDATQFLGKPLVYGSIYQFEGQATVFMPGQDAPCYRCLFPSPPPPGTVPSCAEGGVFGVLPGVIGAIQATEAIKVITGEGDPLIGRLLLYDALHMDFQEVKIRWDADCPVCGKEPTITELIDYEQFCGVPAR